MARLGCSLAGSPGEGDRLDIEEKEVREQQAQARRPAAAMLVVAGQVSSSCGATTRSESMRLKCRREWPRAAPRVCAACNCCMACVELWRPAVNDAKHPASLPIAGRDEGHAQSGDGPEGNDGNGRANSVGEISPCAPGHARPSGEGRWRQRPRGRRRRREQDRCDSAGREAGSG
jgi:hypothetical protein